MKIAVPFAVAALALAVLPTPVSAKERGCPNRLAVVAETERVLDQSLRSGQGVEDARAQFVRAREKALEEGCLAGTQWDRGTRYDRDQRYRDPFGDDRSYLNESERRYESNRGSGREQYLRQRFDELVQLGYRRGLNRDEFRELEELRNKLSR
jgi:hypothetical protein